MQRFLRFLILGTILLFLVEMRLPAQDAEKPATQILGPTGIMSTAPIVEVPVVEEEPIDHATIDAIPVEQRLAKYDFLRGDFDRMGDLTPYFKGMLVGDIDSHSAMEPRFIPFIWQPVGLAGKRVAHHDERSSNRLFYTIEMTGDPKGEAHWKSQTIPVSPGRLYRLVCYVTPSKKEGVYTAGIGDYAQSTWEKIPYEAAPDWVVRMGTKWRPESSRRSFLFLTPEDKDDLTVQLTPDTTPCTYDVLAVYLQPILPIHRGLASSEKLDLKPLAGTSSFIGLPGGEPKNIDHRGGDFLRLGDGEKIEQNEYVFDATFGENGLFHRPLLSASAKFDTDRAVFEKDAEMVYKFALQPIRIDHKPGEFVPPAIAWEQCSLAFEHLNAENGKASVDFSMDGKNWQSFPCSLGKTGTIEPVTFDVKNCMELLVRIRNVGEKPFDVKRVIFRANINSTLYTGEGKTAFATRRNLDSFNKPVENGLVVPLMFSEDYALYKLMINESEEEQPFGCGYMDYSGTGMYRSHGDGPGKWTLMTFGEKWQGVRSHHASVKVWAYNWFDEANSFHFNYPGLSFEYELYNAGKSSSETEEQ